MPKEIQTAIARGTRPSPDKRWQMIQILADEVRKYESNSTCSQCLIICQKITRQYPNSFVDMIPSRKVIAGGFNSLFCLNSKHELRTSITLGASEGTDHQDLEIGGFKQGPTDSYGLTRFQPEPRPEESEETRQTLLCIHGQNGIHGEERAEVTDLMKTTFSLQSRHIKEIPAPSVADLKLSGLTFLPKGNIFSY